MITILDSFFSSCHFFPLKMFATIVYFTGKSIYNVIFVFCVYCGHSCICKKDRVLMGSSQMPLNSELEDIDRITSEPFQKNTPQQAIICFISISCTVSGWCLLFSLTFHVSCLYAKLSGSLKNKELHEKCLYLPHCITYANENTTKIPYLIRNQKH